MTPTTTIIFLWLVSGLLLAAWREATTPSEKKPAGGTPEILITSILWPGIIVLSVIAFCVAIFVAQDRHR